MALRMTGMMSGLDTQSIIQELVAARQTKVDKQKKAQTALSWKQDAWKELNTKLKNLMNKTLGNMRFVSSYSKKTTKVSDSNAASVITGENAVNGVQSLQVKQMAKNAYLTGAKVKGNGEVTALSKLSELDGFRGIEGLEGKGALTLTTGDKMIEIEVTGETTISDVLTQLKNAGLNASFDAKNGRMIISSKESGAANDFSIVASDDAVGKAALSALGLDISAGRATKIDGQDAIIYLNGAEFTDSDNTFDINGLTITVQRETANAGDPTGETITITTEDDTDGIYDMIKSFLKEYNEIVNEMDKLYNAESAGSYEPLTDEEKEALSESEIEKYEQKIKDSLLRRDDNLSTVNSALQSIMSAGVEVNGKTMHLYDFGIDVLGYFNAAENEKHAYHIDGDSDDEFTSGNADKLKTMISNDPDTVITFFSQLSRSLYAKMDELSKSRDGYRSYGNFYDDKKMQSDYDDYTKKIADLEQKLNDYEDMWYRKFSKMETALAKMQSNMSAVTSLLGG